MFSNLPEQVSVIDCCYQCFKNVIDVVHLNILLPFQVTTLKTGPSRFPHDNLKGTVRTYTYTHTDHAKNAGILSSVNVASQMLQRNNPLKNLTYKAFQDKSMAAFLERTD